jgi:hypothetical protein
MEKAVVRQNLTAGIQGSLEQKTLAFGSIASAASSGLFPSGYDNVMKITAACWFADGLGVHPTVYMEGMQPVTFDGKTVREPKWEFVNALLRARLPGFDFEVHEDSEQACELTFHAEGRRPQKVRYTMEHARTQGLANKATYQKNPRQMLWKQCFKLGADRIGADVLAGLPSLVYEDDEGEAAPAPENPKAALDAAVEATQAAAGKRDATDVEFTEAKPAEPAAPVNWKKRLTDTITAEYGKQKPDVVADKVSLLYNQMMLEKTGADPNRKFAKGSDVSPTEAKLIVEWYEARKKGAGKLEGESRNDQGVANSDPTEPVPAPVEAPARPPWSSERDWAVDEPPPTDGEEPPPAEEEGTAEGPPPPSQAYDALMMAVARARKVFGNEPKRRLFVQESPLGSGKFWFVDLRALSAAGLSGSTLLQKGGEVVADVGAMDLLTRTVTEMCDAKERGGR